MRIRPLVPTLLLTACLAACGTAPAATPSAVSGTASGSTGACPVAPGPVAIAVGGHRNAPAPVLSGIARDLVTGHVLAGPGGPPLALISVEGVARVVVAPQSFTSDARNSAAVDRDRSRFLADVDAAVAGLRAQTPESDPLGALALAARTARAGGAGTVVLIDSGVQTAPPLDLREPGVLDADIGDLVGHVRRTGALPDLTGLTVVLVGIGDTADPQTPLDTGRRAHLVALWRAIVEAGGAACVDVDPVPTTSAPVTDGPDVGVVEVPPLPALDGDRLVLPDDATVGFRPGSAEFRDPAAARTALGPIADRLRAEPVRQVLLTGTTARWADAAAQRDLGLRRAAAVRAVLVDAGVDEHRITAVGVGSEFPGYVDDLAADGTQLSGPAARNRTVVVELR
ncbi:OmpA family protein [Pseudonocardia alni]|uniref:OmpA family protein n=1 Tax=Pseudonocardia alni TaxID=33907 RepID=UPI0033E034E4